MVIHLSKEKKKRLFNIHDRPFDLPDEDNFLDTHFKFNVLVHSFFTYNDKVKN